MIYLVMMSNRKKSELVESLSLEVRKFIAGVILFNQRVAEEVGMNVVDLQCLHLLELQGSATPSEFAKWSRMSTGGVTVLLDRLEKAGYVKREPNPNDRRSSIVRPIPSGLRKLHAIYREKGQALRQVLFSHNDRELLVIREFFERTNSTGSAESSCSPSQ
jgi:DNA-binding MarR family transcriptional regulator